MTEPEISRRARIPRVAIVGTGFVGSTTAYALLISGMAVEVVMMIATNDAPWCT